MKPSRLWEPTSLPSFSLERIRASAPSLLILVILGLGAAVRFIGLNWDEFSHIHPDERFLTMVETSIQLPASVGEYFDTDSSPLNPHNVGHGFFVYGTLPIFLVRFVAEAVGKTGYDEVHLVGRTISALFDLFSVYIVYLIGMRLYRRKVALLAALFAALSVLLIQHAHFFVVDPVANTFILGGLYFAVRIYQEGGTIDYVLFGLMLGMSVASKISAAPLAGMAALAALMRAIRSENNRTLSELARSAGLLALAAMLSLVTFRVLQPYAFQGPSFFDVGLNPRWLGNMAEIQAMNRGDTDAPYALQWADRPAVLFAFRNLVLWGLGLPLGLVAWAGWVWAAWESIRGRWERHILILLWTGAFFIWQSSGFTPAMRYQLPIYPTLVLFAAWMLWEAWERTASLRPDWGRVARIGIAALGAITVIWTAVYAIGFAGIYARPVTRVAATRWIYSHIPAAVNVVIDEAGERMLEPIAVTLDVTISSQRPFRTTFKSGSDGSLEGIALPAVHDLSPEIESKIFTLSLSENTMEGALIGVQEASVSLPPEGEASFEVRFSETLPLLAGRSYAVELGLGSAGAVRMNRQFSVLVDSAGGEQRQDIRLPQREYALSSDEPSILGFTSHVNGSAEGVLLPYVIGSADSQLESELKVELTRDPSEPEPLATATFVGALSVQDEAEVEFAFDRPVELVEGERYFLRMTLVEGSALAMRASAIISETTWDDGLPLRIEGYDVGGRYRGLNQELYWNDDQDDDANGISDKLERIVSTLHEGDYLIITSNRQYGTITRVPIRYPLTIAYYRALLGCDEPQVVLECAASAQVTEVPGQLGYELVQVFESNPTLGPIEIRDQLAEEAFTVYDHPKVLIFKKGERFTSNQVFERLDRVDLSHVQHILPKDVGTAQDLLLPQARWQAQQQAGTFSTIFNPQSLINRSDIVALIVWWLFMGLLGVIAFPVTRTAFPGLVDGGYPVARIVGLLVMGWGSWLVGSLGIPVTSLTILIVVLLFAAASFGLFWRRREDFIGFVQKNRKEILLTEIIALGFFLLDLLIRIGNPDLWHPAFGGEKPMDFSYLNAVLKSTTFPPYDPWFSGGYINYYYFGFVIIGMPIKLLGIMPAIAYNLVIPTIFSFLALAGYSVGHNLVARVNAEHSNRRLPDPRIAGAAAAIGIVLLGNLGTARMFFDGFKNIGASPGSEAGGFIGIAQVFRGIVRYITLNAQMPYPLHQWYWNPSRVITPGPGEAGPITEFPFFTFLYSDLHAHMIVRLLTVLAIGWALSWMLHAERGNKRERLSMGVGLVVGGLILGAIRPTNTWDFPVYWALGALAVLYAVWLRYREWNTRAILEALLSATVLIGLAQTLYLPYHNWYGQGYLEARLWDGSRTPLIDYLTVHGLFLFLIVSWMIRESIQWMASTPLSSLQRLRPYAGIIGFGGILFVAAIGLLVGQGYQIAAITFPLMLWAGILLLRPGYPIQKRVVLSLLGIGVALTFVVEVVVLVGDISRMNTVFKFYLQVWEIFCLAGAATLAWMLGQYTQWRPVWRRIWLTMVLFLVFSAALYPLTAAPAKVRDRMDSEAPRSLDGMAFMAVAERFELHSSFPLDEDYAAIKWMQNNIEGTPVIVEANVPEYRWGSRYTIYTGLPGVLGWPNHQRQQRVAGPPGLVDERQSDITRFYLTQSVEEAIDFLQRYEVRYVVLGTLERAYYESVQPCNRAAEGEAISCDMRGYPFGMPQPDVLASECEPVDPQVENGQLVCPTYGMEKFDRMQASGVLREAYHNGQTTIYEVMP